MTSLRETIEAAASEYVSELCGLSSGQPLVDSKIDFEAGFIAGIKALMGREEIVELVNRITSARGIVCTHAMQTYSRTADKEVGRIDNAIFEFDKLRAEIEEME